MECNIPDSCRKCGILQDSISFSKSKRYELCRACRYNESTELTNQTPCGQCYCKCCGFLIDSDISHAEDLIDSESHAQDLMDSDISHAQALIKSNYCLACYQIQRACKWNQGLSTSAQGCACEFCSNHYNFSCLEQEYSELVLRNERQISQVQSCIELEESCGREKALSDKHADPPREKQSQVKEETRNKWEREQLLLKEQLSTEDSPEVKEILQSLRQENIEKRFYIGGVDISFIKDNNQDACAALVILSFPDLEVVYKRLEMIKLTAAYIPGFLAFREIDSIIHLYNTMLQNAPQYRPNVIFVDGNGQLHPRGFGLACHLGVELNVSTVGVAKTLIHVDDIEMDSAHKFKHALQKGGDTFPLTTDEGVTLGQALRSTDSTTNPIYVSVGHKISLQSAVTLVHQCCKYRIPEPTRYADIFSRQFLANEQHAPEEVIVTGKNAND